MNRVLFRQIICAVDLSGQSASLVKNAMQLASLHDSELLVVHVTHGRLETTESTQRATTDAFAALRRLTEAQLHLLVPVRWIMVQGNPATEVARFVRRMGADLTVVGGALTRPSSGVVGAVAHAILTTTNSPVLVIPRTPSGEGPPNPYRKILCGVSSGLSMATLRYALSFAQEFESRLTLLTVDDGHRTSPGEEVWNSHDRSTRTPARPNPWAPASVDIRLTA